MNKFNKLLLIVFIFFFASPAHATNYWYGGSGNWSDATNHWSYNSGNSPAAAAPMPTTTTNVIFDTNSSANSYTVTLNTVATSSDFTLGNPASGVVTLASTGVTVSTAVDVYGSMSLASGAIWTASSTLTFRPPTGTTKTLTSNGVELTVRNFTINGAGTLQLADKLTFKNLVSTTALTLARSVGSFDANNQEVELAGLGTTISGSTSFTGSNAFYDLTVTGSTAGNNQGILGQFSISGLTVDNNFVINGFSSTTRAFVYSNISAGGGSPATITAANVSATNADFMDITGAGAASWDLSAATGGSGNCGGNSFKSLGDAAFTASTTLYWYADTGNWGDSGHWYLGSGGAGGLGRVPLCHDNVVFDNASFTGSGKTITSTVQRLGANIDWSEVIGQTWAMGSLSTTAFGNFTFSSSTALTGSSGFTLDMKGRGQHQFTSNGKTFPSGMSLRIYASDGGYTLMDALSLGNNRKLTIGSGIFDANDQNVTIGYFDGSGTYPRSIYMGSGTWTIAGSADNLWYLATVTNLNFYAEQSTIKLISTLTAARPFTGGSKTYNNFWNNTTGAYAVLFSGSNTFNDFKVDAGRTILFTANTISTTTTATLLGTSGSHITIGTITAATSTLAKAGGGTICGDYLDISRVKATPDTTWYVTNSTNDYNFVGNGWVSGACPVAPVLPNVSPIIFLKNLIFKRNVIFK
ncbi:MAG: hypothetical protein WCS97_01030 [Candidatus Paceibacterota bacterium]